MPAGTEAPVTVRSQTQVAFDAFTVGQWVRVHTDPDWPISVIDYSPDRSGMCSSMLTSHPNWTAEGIGFVTKAVKVGREIPRVTTAFNVTQPGVDTPVDRVLKGLGDLGYRVRQKRAGEWRAKCPYHLGKTSESLSVREFRDGSASVHCFSGCTTEQVLSVIP